MYISINTVTVPPSLPDPPLSAASPSLFLCLPDQFYHLFALLLPYLVWWSQQGPATITESCWLLWHLSPLWLPAEHSTCCHQSFHNSRTLFHCQKCSGLTAQSCIELSCWYKAKQSYGFFSACPLTQRHILVPVNPVLEALQQYSKSNSKQRLNKLHYPFPM